jgi:hypothetical protein
MGLGVSLVQMAGDPNNKTGLTSSKVLSFAQSYIASSDGIFNGVAPTAFAATTTAIISPATNAWARKTISVIPTASSPFGLDTVELIVDGVSVATSANAAPASFSLNTTAYADGAHTLTVRSTDRGGFVTTTSIQSKIDNTPPTTTGAMSIQFIPFYGSTVAGTAADNLSGVAEITVLTSNLRTPPITLTPATGVWSVISPNPGYIPPVISLRVRDGAGNCSDYTAVGTAATYVPPLTLITAGTCP